MIHCYHWCVWKRTNAASVSTNIIGWSAPGVKGLLIVVLSIAARNSCHIVANAVENVEGFQVAKRRSGFVSDVSVTLISCHNDCVQEGVTQEAVAVAAQLH